MVDPALSVATGELLRALLARKGEAVPAVPAPATSPTGTVRRPAGAATRSQRSDTNPPLAFLIARRPAAAMGESESGLRREAVATEIDPRLIEIATARRRSLTVRLHLEDFLRLRALSEASATTYQSLIEAGVLAVLSGTGGSPTAPAQTPTQISMRKRHSLGR